MGPKYHSLPRGKESSILLGGGTVHDCMDIGFNRSDLDFYLPAVQEEVKAASVKVHHMGFYESWVSQDKYYYAVGNCGFKPN